MSEEEKKAIEILKEIKDVRGIRQDVEGENEDLWALDIVYNLIDKQQKEIEEKSIIIMAGAEKVKQLEKEIEELKKENDEIWGHLPRLD